MIRVLKYVGMALGALVVVIIAAPLFRLVGRAPRAELVVDADLLADDPGVDVDGDQS